jgi:hypothetical protein
MPSPLKVRLPVVVLVVPDDERALLALQVPERDRQLRTGDVDHLSSRVMPSPASHDSRQAVAAEGTPVPAAARRQTLAVFKETAPN